MESALVVAIIRGDALEPSEKKLHEIGVSGITVIKARGFGEHSLPHDILGRPLMNDQAKIEVYVAREKAERVATALIEAANSAGLGDGIVAILPVQRAYSVRTRSDAMPNAACR